MTRSKLYTIIACVYCGCLVAANTIAGKTFDILGWTWTSAFIVFPITYIINDVMTEVYGFRDAQRIILTGFAVNLLAVIVYQLGLMIPGSASFMAQGAFETVLGTTVRATASSFCGYLVGSTLNALVMQRMHDAHGDQHLMARCVTSTFVGEIADALVFNVMMWVGILPIEVIATTVVTYGIGKVLYEVVVYPVTRVAIRYVKGLEA